MFMGLLTSIANASNHAIYFSLSNQKYMTQTILINLYPNEFSQEFDQYPFAVKSARCVGSCSTLNDLFNKVCVSNKTEDSNLNVLHMIRGIKKSKTLAKHMSWEYKCKFHERKCKSDQWWNNDK